MGAYAEWVDGVDLSALSRQAQGSRRYADDCGGVAQVEPGLDTVISMTVDRDAVVGAQRGDPLPGPPLALAETDDGPSRGPFSFWFQRGLVVATALRRLSKRSKSVSEPHLSLIDRPRSAEGRFQNSI